MKIALKSVGPGLDVKNRGIEFSVSTPDGEHLGDLYLRKAGLVWCKGKKGIDAGEAISWKKFVKWAEHS